MKKLICLLLLAALTVAATGCATTSSLDSNGKKYPPIEHRDAAGHYR